MKWLENKRWIAVCPEQLGGLKTPRDPAEIRSGRVLTKKGEDVTEAFEKGAKRTLRLAQQLNVELAILKAYSPSCGCQKIYDGNHRGHLISGKGLAASQLEKAHIPVCSEKIFFEKNGEAKLCKLTKNRDL